MGKTNYDDDVVLWSREQAALLRSGKLSLLDLEHIADEIEDVGKSEQRELAARMVVLLANLLKWKYQPALRGSSWRTTIKTQRNGVSRRVDKTPGLKASLADREFWIDVWGDAIDQTVKETGLTEEALPDACPWPIDKVLSNDWLPD